MTITTTQVVGPVVLPDDSKLASSKVIFELTKPSTDGAVITVDSVEAAIDPITGEIDIDLWSNDADPIEHFYNVTVETEFDEGRVRRNSLGKAVVPATGPANLHDILVDGPVATGGDGVLISLAVADAEAAQAGAELAQAGAETARDETNAALGTKVENEQRAVTFKDDYIISDIFGTRSGGTPTVYLPVSFWTRRGTSGSNILMR